MGKDGQVKGGQTKIVGGFERRSSFQRQIHGLQVIHFSRGVGCRVRTTFSVQNQIRKKTETVDGSASSTEGCAMQRCRLVLILRKNTGPSIQKQFDDLQLLPADKCIGVEKSLS